MKISTRIKRYLKGSMTVEAAMILPIFFIIMVNLLSIVDMIGLYATMEAALHQTGREMALNLHAYNLMGNGCDISDENGVLLELGLREGYARGLLFSNLDTDSNYISLLTDKITGITFMRSDILNNEDIVDLAVTYRVTPYLNVFRIQNSVYLNRCRIHVWNGYNKNTNQDEEGIHQWVYITDNASVYHTEGNCSHLTLTISKIGIQQLENARNDNGAKYTACAFCAVNTNVGPTLYIAREGDRFHCDRKCSGLKRTVKCVDLAELSGVGCCQRCMENGGDNGDSW